MPGPTVYTRLPEDEPGHRGEVQFAKHLVDLTDESTHLWFSVDYLPGVTDLDLLLCHQRAGFFCVEVKAFALDAIREYSAAHMVVAGRSGSKHPLKQARRAQLKLVEYLKAVRVSPPFFYTIAAFPKIGRSAFLQRFGGASAVQLQAAGMLFAEDLVSEEAMAARLMQIQRRPPFGAAPQYPRAPRHDEIRAVAEAIDPAGSPTASRSDLERSAVLRVPVTKTSRRQNRLASYIEPGTRQPTVFHGYPGTGKTYYLLRIALEHAKAGRSVLFLCFNKVLASDIRRMLSTTGFPKEVARRIDVAHAWALRGRYSDAYVDGDDGVLGELPSIFADQTPLEEYGTVCVDEAQDLPEWAFRLVDWHAESGAEWFLANGPGQELYAREPCPYMSQLMRKAFERGTVERLRRVYRTAQVDFLVAQGLYEHAPDVVRIPRWVADHPLPSPKKVRGEEMEALFDTPLDAEFDSLGALPAVVEIPRWSEALAQTDRDLRRSRIREVLRGELAEAAAAGRPGDVAVLLRHVKQPSDADDARAVLADLQVPYIDQIDSKNRDLLLPAGHVRLVSFVSARGIEAHRTVLLGFDDLGDGSADALRDSRNQAYIALSRAKAGTTVITRPHRRGPLSAFLVDLVNAYSTSRQAHVHVSPAASRLPRVATVVWQTGTVARIVEDRGFGFIQSTQGSEVFFHRSSLLGVDFEAAVGRTVHFVAIDADRGDQATIVAHQRPTAHGSDPQPGYEAAFVSEPVGGRGFGFLLVPTLAKRVFFHVNQVAGGQAQLGVGDRVDVLIDDRDVAKPRASLVAPRG